jgi:transposase-like protein
VRRTLLLDQLLGDRRGNAGEEGDAAVPSVVADEQARAGLRLNLDVLAREGARRMLAAALEAKVHDDLTAHAAERDERGRRLVVGNGHARGREVTTGAGAIPIRAPRGRAAPLA